MGQAPRKKHEQFVEEAQRARLLARELYISVQEASPKHFFDALRVKQDIILAFMDSKGILIEDPNCMARGIFGLNYWAGGRVLR